jgi:hypothetical protein
VFEELSNEEKLEEDIGDVEEEEENYNLDEDVVEDLEDL